MSGLVRPLADQKNHYPRATTNRLRKGRKGNIMKLTRASSYALQALAEMVGDKQDSQNPFIPSHRTAQGSGIPGGFLLKVLKPLVNARILMSLKGPHGGYRLARPASKVTLLEVIEAVDGPLRGFAPLAGGKASAAVRQEVEAFQQDARGLLPRANRNRILLTELMDASAPRQTRAHRDPAGRLILLTQPSLDEQYAAKLKPAAGILDDKSAQEYGPPFVALVDKIRRGQGAPGGEPPLPAGVRASNPALPLPRSRFIPLRSNRRGRSGRPQ